MVMALVKIHKKIRIISLKKRVLFAASCGLSLALLTLKLGPGMIGGGTDLIKDMLFGKNEAPGWPLFIGRYIGLIVTYIVGSAGGIFAPSPYEGEGWGGVWSCSAITARTHSIFSTISLLLKRSTIKPRERINSSRI